MIGANRTGTLIRLLTERTGTGKLRLGPEERECVAFANRLRQLSITGELRAVWTHIPNELAGASDKTQSNLAKIRYAIGKAMGMVAGAADYVFLAESGSFCIEMKSSTGKQTANQSDFQAWCEMIGVPYAIARSAAEAEECLQRWQLLRKQP